MEKKQAREQESISKMIFIYCNKHHNSSQNLCEDCTTVSEYAAKCISLCPYGDDKPVCGKCPSNCFRGDMYGKMVKIMRFAGPRMLYKHPILTVKHILDAFKKPQLKVDRL